MAQKKKGGFFSSLGQAIESVADSVDKAAKGVSKDFANTVSSPLDHLKVGNIVILVSRTCGKCLRVTEAGIAEFNGNPVQEPELACRLEVVASNSPNPKAIKLRSVCYPHSYLAVMNGYFVAYGQGGPECDFIPSTVSEAGIVLSGPGTWAAFESASIPGSHIGVLPSGEITAPAQTPKTTTAAHMKVNFVDTVKTQPSPQLTQAQPQQQQQVAAGYPPPAAAAGQPQPQYPPPQVQGGPPPPHGQYVPPQGTTTGQYVPPPGPEHYVPSAPPPST